MSDSDIPVSSLDGLDSTWASLREAHPATNRPGMDSPQPPPPIFKLPQELLWHIFVLNSHTWSNFYLDEATARFLDEAETTTEAALITNRNTSQVCRRWRELMLRSPSIWANSLDLNVLDQKGYLWRAEVLKRTGNAPLTIVGEMDHRTRADSFCSNCFILEVLEEQWHRLRSLTICTRGLYHDEKLRLLTQRPAPNIEHFTCFMSQWRDGIETTEHFIPFSNQAPRLRSFCSQANEFRLLGSSFDNLRHFWLKYSDCVFTAAELLRGLQQMPLLKSLFFEEIDLRPKTMEETSPIVQLLHLTGVTAVEDSKFLGALIHVIPYIKAGRGCKLTVFLTQNVLDDVAPAFSTFFKNNVDPSNTTGIHYVLEENVYEGTKLTVCFCGPHTEPIYLSIAFLMYQGIYDAFYSMAKSLSFIDIRSVKNLKFCIEGVAIDTLCQHGSIGDIITLLQTLQSVAELHSDPGALRLLARLDKYIGITSRASSASASAAATTLPSLSFLRTDLYHDDVMKYCSQRYDMGTALQNVHVKEGHMTISWGVG